jgi:PUA domain protein
MQFSHVLFYIFNSFYIEGKKHAIAVGTTTMTSEDIMKINKGVAVETVHYLQDGLWQTKTIA